MPDIDVPPVVVAALWFALVVWAFWWGVPLVVCSIESTRYANGGEEDPPAIEPDGSDPLYTAAFEALVKLGYDPVGPAWVRFSFYLRWWEHRAVLRVFRHPTAGRFAYLQTTDFHPEWPQLHFITCWADGGLMRTTTDFSEAAGVVGGYDTEHLRLTTTPAALEARHAEREAALEARGGRRDPDLSLDTLLAAERRHSYVAVAVPAAHAAWAEFGGMLVLGFVLVCASAMYFTTWPALPPTAGLALLAAVQFTFRVRLARSREYVREQLRAAAEGTG